jgi:predicted RNA-binding Zn-ribbon protein involved in translation (DUF1610 family)
MWKTKRFIRTNGTSAVKMICQNSNLNLSKWSDYGPEGEACNIYTEVSEKTTAVLCPECTQRSVNNVGKSTSKK